MNVTPMFFLSMAGAAFVVVLVAGRYWSELNSRDLGTMSRQWVAEYNAQHP